MARKPAVAFLLALACLFEAHSKAAALNSPLDLFWGSCVLDADPKNVDPFSDAYAAICIKPELHQSVSIQQTSNENQYDHYSRIYIGLHTPGSIGIHWSAYQKAQTNDGPDTKVSITRTTDTATLSIGKLGLRRFIFTAGKKKMDFGINVKPKGAFIESISSPEFWDSPDYSATATWDNLVDATGQVSVGIDDPEELLFLEKELKNLSISGRIIYDSPAWFGTRFVLSGLAHHNGERRFGLGMLNIASFLGLVGDNRRRGGGRADSMPEWEREGSRGV